MSVPKLRIVLERDERNRWTVTADPGIDEPLQVGDVYTDMGGGVLVCSLGRSYGAVRQAIMGWMGFRE